VALLRDQPCCHTSDDCDQFFRGVMSPGCFRYRLTAPAMDRTARPVVFEEPRALATGGDG